eukprot:715142-Rhodomonas_salina.2
MTRTGHWFLHFHQFIIPVFSYACNNSTEAVSTSKDPAVPCAVERNHERKCTSAPGRLVPALTPSRHLSLAYILTEAGQDSPSAQHQTTRDVVRTVRLPSPLQLCSQCWLQREQPGPIRHAWHATL